MNKLEILNNIFKYPSFRDGQDEVIDAALDYQNNKGVLVIMPTGGGKSLCYQIPSLVMGGLNVVISPLISLMKDQVDAISKRGVQATTYNSSMSVQEKEGVLGQLQLGIIELLYVSPERLDDDSFVELLKSIGVNIFAVDESHAVSMWGHDFRPAYRRIKKVSQYLQPKQVMALTATATKPVQDDICEQLGIPQAKRFVRGFFRNNLSVKIEEVEYADRIPDIVSQVSQYYKKGIHTGIVYTGTKKQAEAIAGELNEYYHVPTAFYHAGMNASERTAIQDNWFKNGGPLVATTAFGMGIDKPDVRYVIHATTPGNIESWWQEIGRAGRDGLLSVCRTYTSFASDYRLQMFFINISCPPAETVSQLWYWLNNQAKFCSTVSMTQEDMARRAQIDPQMMSGCLAVLKKAGLVTASKKSEYIVQHLANPKDANIDYAALKQKRKAKQDRLNEMIRFIKDDKNCRMLNILDYFGDYSHTEPCGKCDFCLKNT